MGKLINSHYYLHNEPNQVDVFEVANADGNDSFTLVGLFILRENNIVSTAPIDYEHYDEMRANAIAIFKGNIIVEL